MRIRAKIDRDGSIWLGYPKSVNYSEQMSGFNPAITGKTLALILSDRFSRDMIDTPFWIEVDDMLTLAEAEEIVSPGWEN